jgi:hypothetical protein
MREQCAGLALKATNLFAKLRSVEVVAHGAGANRWHCIPPGVAESNAFTTGFADRLGPVQ